MNKAAKILAAASLALTLVACGGTGAADNEAPSAQAASTEAKAIAGTYTRYVQGDDWGAGVSKITLTLEEPIDAFSADNVNVVQTTVSPDWAAEGMPLVMATAERTITDAYLVDESGARTEDASATAVVEMAISPSEGSPFTFNAHITRNEWSPYKLDIDANVTANGETATLEIAPNPVGTETSVDNFSYDTYEASNGTTYGYAYYEPEEASDTLVVWLHGGGEGHVREEGTDPSIPLLGNEAGNLADEEFQSTVGGAHILAPQCPSYWMDQEGHDNIAVQDYTLSTNKSFYTESLHELIMAYKDKVGAEKVVLTGCSNGGYMTLLQAITYPKDYDAYVMCCESLKAESISDEDIQAIKDLPLFFIWSSDDDTVKPEDCSATNVKRLQDAGASDLHVFNPDHVVDTSGRFDDADGNAYQYSGHWSWIYFDNNEAVDADGLGTWDFIAERVK